MWLVRHGNWEKYEYIEATTISEAVDIAEHLQDEGVDSKILHCSTPHSKVQKEYDRRRDNLGNISKPRKGTNLHSKALKSIAELKTYWCRDIDKVSSHKRFLYKGNVVTMTISGIDNAEHARKIIDFMIKSKNQILKHLGYTKKSNWNEY